MAVSRSNQTHFGQPGVQRTFSSCTCATHLLRVDSISASLCMAGIGRCLCLVYAGLAGVQLRVVLRAVLVCDGL